VGRIYSPTDIALERDFSYLTSQVKYLMRKVDSLDKENKQLHEEVSELKQLVFKIKNQENAHLQNPPADCPNLQSEIRTLQDELKSQQALLKQETKTQQKTLNSWVEVVKKREQPPQLAEVEGVIQAKLNEERLRRTRELNLRVRGLPPSEASSDPLQIGTSFLHNTLDLKDITLERAWMGPNSTLLLVSGL
jgi:chromosome segregation ATPase